MALKNCRRWIFLSLVFGFHALVFVHDRVLLIMSKFKIIKVKQTKQTTWIKIFKLIGKIVARCAEHLDEFLRRSIPLRLLLPTCGLRNQPPNPIKYAKQHFNTNIHIFNINCPASNEVISRSNFLTREFAQSFLDKSWLLKLILMEHGEIC